MRIIDVLTQTDLTQNLQSGTIFRFTNDISLSTDVVLPYKVILQFCGGKITKDTSINHAITITADYTIIEAAPYQIFENITISGLWNCDHAYFEWFGALGDGRTDDRAHIQEALDSSTFPDFFLLNKTYMINSHYVSSDVTESDAIGLSINRHVQIVGQSWSTISTCSNDIQFNVLVQINSSGVGLTGFNITGNNPYHDATNQIQELLATRHITASDDNHDYNSLSLIGMGITSCVKNCVNLNTFLSRLENVTTGWSETGFIIRGFLTAASIITRTSTTLSGCYCSHCTKYGYKLMEMTYCLLQNCAVDFSNALSPLSDTDRSDGNPCTFGCPYYFLYCSSISLIACGCEVSKNIMYLNHCQCIKIDTLSHWYDPNESYPTTDNDQLRRIYISNCNSINFSQCVMGTDDPFISTHNEQNIGFNGCLVRTSNGSVSGTLISAALINHV